MDTFTDLAIPIGSKDGLEVHQGNGYTNALEPETEGVRLRAPVESKVCGL